MVPGKEGQIANGKFIGNENIRHDEDLHDFLRRTGLRNCTG